MGYDKLFPLANFVQQDATNINMTIMRERERHQSVLLLGLALDYK